MKINFPPFDQWENVPLHIPYKLIWEDIGSQDQPLYYETTLILRCRRGFLEIATFKLPVLPGPKFTLQTFLKILKLFLYLNLLR